MKWFYRMILRFTYLSLTISLYTQERNPHTVASFNQRLQDFQHSTYAILLPLPPNAILYISFLRFFFFNSKHRIAKRERIMTKRDWGCVSPKFLTIFCVSMLLHHHNSPWMDLLEVTPNPSHQATPNRPILLLSIQPIVFQVCWSAKVTKFDQESRTLYYIKQFFLEIICYNHNSRLKNCIVW